MFRAFGNLGSKVCLFDALFQLISCRMELFPFEPVTWKWEVDGTAEFVRWVVHGCKNFNCFRVLLKFIFTTFRMNVETTDKLQVSDFMAVDDYFQRVYLYFKPKKIKISSALRRWEMVREEGETENQKNILKSMTFRLQPKEIRQSSTFWWL